MKRTVLVSGCFDVIHAGHVALLRQASQYGDRLIVAINSDESISRIKGPSRPINNERDRIDVVGAIRWVDGVVVFNEDTVGNTLLRIRPDVWVKGGDWTIETLNQSEVAVANVIDCDIVIVPETVHIHTSQILSK